MEHPKVVGDHTTLIVMQALEAVGYTLAVPFGENARYDLVIDDGNRLSRVQCKTGRLRQGAVRFSVCSTYHHHAQPLHWSRHYLGEVEYFAVYALRLTACISSRSRTLRSDQKALSEWPRLETSNGKASAKPPATS